MATYHDSDEAFRRPPAGENPLSVAGMLLVGLALTAGAVWLMVQEANSVKPREVAGQEQETEAPESDKPDGPKKRAAKPLPTFEEAYAEAEKLAGRADADEPGLTRAALARLDEPRRKELRAATEALLPRAADDLADRAPELTRDGLTAWVSMASRRVARGDRTFKGVARAAWDPSAGAGGILSLMNVWGTLTPKARADAAAAARSGARTTRPGADARRTLAGTAGLNQ